MTDPTPSFKPGDVANGHVLSNDGQWVPMNAATGMVPPPPQPKKSHKVRNWTLGIVGGLIVFGIIGSAMGGEEKKQPETKVAQADSSATDAKDEKPKAEEKDDSEPAEPKVKAVKVDAGTILDQFEKNEAAADAKYDGKLLQVRGVVEKVDTEFWDEDQYVVQLTDGDDWAIWSVNCNDLSADVAAKVKVGSKLTVTGQFDDGGDLGVEIADCKIG